MEKKVMIRERRFINILSWVLFIIYLIGLFYFLFFSEHYGRTEETSGYRYNLVLFREIKRFIIYRHVLGLEGFFVNFFGNILAFMPFGFCLPLLNKKDDKLFRIFFGGLGFSFMIEAIQLIYKIGCFDVDDLLLNTMGGILGFFIYHLFRYFVKRFR